MAFATALAQTPEKRRGATTRPLAHYLSNSDTGHSAAVLRLQCLQRAGILGSRAELIAQLAWGCPS